MIAFVLIVLMTNLTYESPGSSSYSHTFPTVSFQEFKSEQACMFAGQQILNRTQRGQTNSIKAVCVPKG